MAEPQPTKVDLLLLVSRTLKFASDHPYAATGIFGAAVGSAATYQVLTRLPDYEKVSQAFTPKVYEFALPQEDLRHMLSDPSTEVRWDMPEISVIITAEKREQPKQLQVVDADVVENLHIYPPVCKCGHDLSDHPPLPEHPFAWPCGLCDCSEYDEVERF